MCIVMYISMPWGGGQNAVEWCFRGRIGGMTNSEVMMGAQCSAAAVTNALFDIQDNDVTAFPPIDPMKLQKLLFYAHAWWLARTDTPLFPEDVEAWPWGPVVRDIYVQFSDLGFQPIVGRRAVELIKIGDGYLDYRLGVPAPAPANINSFLGSVWTTHKSLTGIQLSNSTHGPGEPWTIVRDRYGSLDTKPRIPNDLIRDVFKAKAA